MVAAMDHLDLGLKDKVAIVTGGSEGLGLACVQRLARCGARVATCARRPDVLSAAASRIGRETGADILALPADVTRADDIARFVDSVRARFGGVDILINNAGTSAAHAFASIDDAAWQQDFELKVLAAVRMCRLVLPLMQARGGGAVINVTTIAGKAPTARGLPTSLSRAAGINLTKALACEYAAQQIRVNTICLGIVKSAQWQRRASGDLERFYADVAAARQIPLGRVGEAEEFADLVAFLVSDCARYITGTAINFDGGAAAVV